ncbi:MAG TPA: hypothetical protein VH988_07790 [Thermoanaerobaculia bacterium]|jgi:hypothetical protein|nr:hypothetical protein [Thermoanaerobaculia bacterium]
MYRLLASAPEDGWAFVQHGDAVMVIRPPYADWSRTFVQPDTVETAILQHGFLSEDRSFPDLASLIDFLKEQINTSRRARGEEVPDAAAIRELFHFAPRYILTEYLDRIKTEVIPNREWNAAESILTDLLGVEIIKKDQELYERTRNLLIRCQEARAEEEERLRELVSREQNPAQFPRISREYGPAVFQLQGSRERRGSLMVGGYG